MKNEPAITVGVIAGAIVALASALNIELKLDTVETIIAALVPVIAAVFTRPHVKPVAKR